MTTSLGIAYRLALPAPHTHLFEVEVRVENVTDPVRLVLPSWTPGSYLLREFARNVQTFTAADGAGNSLPWTKTDKSTWEIGVPADRVVCARYSVYANEPTVRTSHLDASHAYINGASMFMYADGRENCPVTLQIEVPPQWHATSTFRGGDYHALIDSPIEVGTHAVFPFDVSGVPHRYAVWGRGNLDPDRLVTDTQRIIRAAEAFWGGLPYEDYTFILHLLPGGQGGLEHRNSCSLQADPWAFRGRNYENFLALVAHEHLHAWNATRLRPSALARVDYTRENYTRDLWVVEGLTTYYTDRILRAAGILTPERYLERVAEMITRLQSLPGRHVQSLADSSFDTWIRFYRPNENTPNSQISYYQKGALVGLLLDLRIRRSTENRHSLDDVMRLLWERFGTETTGYPEGAVEQIAEQVCGVPLDGFFQEYLRGTAELDFAGELAAAGLTLVPAPDSGTSAAGEVQLGIRVRDEGGRPRVTHVLAGTPAWEAGINAGDELVALDGYRVYPGTLAARLAERTPGERARFAVFRRDELLNLEVTLQAPPQTTVRVERLPDPGPLQETTYRSWLHLDPGTASG